ncbi:hypothetical protein [Subtercola frigoramans]|uniref:Uncharacterized protein n=1 Tax=Subtercola frigoramans TaxID=120298 RepID=A0ABS2L5L8_9MICO|nr:hypothetical protein [Subtercola frigoramans]MBM7472329.1 hypothetical protein [Subtercola frigoramans]
MTLFRSSDGVLEVCHRNCADYRDRGLLFGADQGVEFLQMIQDVGMAMVVPVVVAAPISHIPIYFREEARVSHVS